MKNKYFLQIIQSENSVYMYILLIFLRHDKRLKMNFLNKKFLQSILNKVARLEGFAQQKFDLLIELKFRKCLKNTPYCSELLFTKLMCFIQIVLLVFIYLLKGFNF